MVKRSKIRIVSKAYRVSNKDETLELNGAYAWDAQWKIDDLNNIPRKVRGTDKDRRLV